MKFIEKIIIKIKVKNYSSLLNFYNKQLGEGVINWSYLNVLWELKFGTIKRAKEELRKFIDFVNIREEIYKSKIISKK